MVLACQALSILRVRVGPQCELDEEECDSCCKALLKKEGVRKNFMMREELF